MITVNFYEPTYEPSVNFTYSVICARYDQKWIYVRHHKRSTYEIPGGHIEEGETPDEAASRELMEETGALEFNIERVASYSVTIDGQTGWGRLYYAEVSSMGDIPDTSEIAEAILLDTFPEQSTHPGIQPYLFRRVNDFLSER
ncbi:MAG TPA: NUDIX domain-containing protein [Bacteroidales bacterium]|nr:NUDIX domain-containing protein [Bacteroidales bacterium]